MFSSVPGVLVLRMLQYWAGALYPAWPYTSKVLYMRQWSAYCGQIRVKGGGHCRIWWPQKKPPRDDAEHTFEQNEGESSLIFLGQMFSQKSKQVPRLWGQQRGWYAQGLGGRNVLEQCEIQETCVKLVCLCRSVGLGQSGLSFIQL